MMVQLSDTVNGSFHPLSAVAKREIVVRHTMAANAHFQSFSQKEGCGMANAHHAQDGGMPSTASRNVDEGQLSGPIGKGRNGKHWPWGADLPAWIQPCDVYRKKQDCEADPNRRPNREPKAERPRVGRLLDKPNKDVWKPNGQQAHRNQTTARHLRYRIIGHRESHRVVLLRKRLCPQRGHVRKGPFARGNARRPPYVHACNGCRHSGRSRPVADTRGDAERGRSNLGRMPRR